MARRIGCLNEKKCFRFGMHFDGIATDLKDL